MKKLLLILLLFPFIIQSQSINLYHLGGNAGVNALHFNPSLIAGTKFSWHFNLGNIQNQTSLDALNNVFVPFSNFKIGTKLGNARTTSANIFGPSFMYQTPKLGSFAISTKYTALQAGSFDFNTLSTGENVYKSYGFTTYSFSYAYQFVYKAHAAAFGASLLSHKNYVANTANKLINDDFVIISNLYPQTLNFSNLLKAKGGSTGVDFGFNYEYRPKHSDYAYMMDGKSYYRNDENKYAFRFSIAVVGNGTENVFSKNNYTILTAKKKANSQAVTSNTEVNQFLKDYKLEKTTTEGKIAEAFSPFININLEGKLGNSGWYVGAVSSQPTQKSKVTLENFQQGFYGFYPRYEKSGKGEFAMPIVYQSETKKLGLGLHFRIGAVTFGSEGINSFFSKKAISPSFYVGINFGKLLAKIKDKDGDAVSDKLDKCPDLAGVWAFKGCPDSDNDGIEDKLDKCPENAGPKATNGCPDADGDGIFDNIDACPKVAGIAKFNGCPDTDGDGIMDSEDDCPTQQGKLEDGGCPDTDGDGIIDNKDKCPKEKGTKENKGCPK